MFTANKYVIELTQSCDPDLPARHCCVAGEHVGSLICSCPETGVVILTYHVHRAPLENCPTLPYMWVHLCGDLSLFNQHPLNVLCTPDSGPTPMAPTLALGEKLCFQEISSYRG